MTNTSSYPITVDGVRLDTLGYNVTGITYRVPGVRSGEVRVPGLHGALPSYDEDFEEAGYTLSLWLKGADVDGVIPADSVGQLRANLDTLLGLFGVRHRLLDVRETVATGVTRQALCQVRSSFAPEIDPGRLCQFKAELVIPGAFWQDPATADFAQAGVTSGTTYTVTTLSGATAPVQDSKILVTGPAANPRVTDIATGHSVLYGGTLAAGSKWLINCETFASRVGASLTLASLDTDGADAQALTSFTRPSRYLTLVPDLSGGSRLVRASLTGSGFTGATSLAIRARRKFL